MSLSRRRFLQGAGAVSVLFLGCGEKALRMLAPVSDIPNPLAAYPDRDWEKLYRNLYEPDSSFIFGCQPNDTHNCLLRAYVKNNVVSFIGPSFGYGKAEDVYGNKASHRWDPRCCIRGLVMGRRFYGDRRIKGAMVRKGFKQWADAGFPRNADGTLDPKYLNRGRDEWSRMDWDDAYELVARGYSDIATTYSGEAGKARLTAQNYDADMIETTHGAGTQVLKFRGGMPLLGGLRIFGCYRVANMMSLLDHHVRDVGPDEAIGGRGFDNFSWHTDLPPGHTQVTGQQAIDFDLINAEYAKLIVCWGMNWTTTKMPDAHWLSEARAKGARVATVACEYQATSNKADDVILVRPGSDPAFALGMIHVILKEKLHDVPYVKRFTDLPLLVRSDTLELLRAKDVIPNYKQTPPSFEIDVMANDAVLPPPTQQGRQMVREKVAKDWHDPMIYDLRSKKPVALPRDAVGKNFAPLKYDPALEGRFAVKLADGSTVEARPVFSLITEYASTFDPKTVSKIAWCSEEAVINLAREIAKNRGRTLITVGMGPNHFFNNDLKDRTILLVGALTGNIGQKGGNVGSFSGNYRGAYFNGIGQWTQEDMFGLELDAAKPAKVKYRYKMESAHYYNYGDRPLKVGNRNFTGKSHMPTPTKALWMVNANSLLGNAKWHYDVVMNTLPRMDMIVVNDWWWTASCEYADVVFGVDSVGEMKTPDISAAVTNPFLHPIPVTPLPRIHNTVNDVETYAGVARALAAIWDDERFSDAWKFITEKTPEIYIQRFLNASSTTKGYRIEELLKNAEQGIPALLMTRTYPKWMGSEQTVEGKPWYTKSGRLEFYRDEPEFREHGENIPIYREPVDGTIYEPNVIVARPNKIIRPVPPETWGIDRADLSCETRQVRNVVMTPEELLKSRHPLRGDGYDMIFITPKFRHGAHTTPIDTDFMAIWAGPFTDIYRHDKRMPHVSEGYVDLHPAMAKKLGLNDGDYVYLDADPADRPYRNWKKGSSEYKVARCVLRVRYYPGTLPHVARTFFHMFTATFGSVEGHETRKDGLAKSPRTNYQAMYRYGGHQSGTRAWLRPTLQGENMARKNYAGQLIDKGFEPDVNCVVGAPKEAVIRLTKLDDGGEYGGLWRSASLGFRHGYENDQMKRYLIGDFVKIL